MKTEKTDVQDASEAPRANRAVTEGLKLPHPNLARPTSLADFFYLAGYYGIYEEVAAQIAPWSKDPEITVKKLPSADVERALAQLWPPRKELARS